MPGKKMGPNKAMVARMAMERAQGSDENRDRKRQMMGMSQVRPQLNLDGVRKRLSGGQGMRPSGY